MKPEYINALKAGVKTAVAAFITAFIGLVSSLLNLVIKTATDASTSGSFHMPNLDFVPGALLALVLALAAGIGTALYRFVQAAGVPGLMQIFDKLLGAVPSYVPQNTGTAIKSAGEMIEPGPAPSDHVTDRGDVVVVLLLTVILIGVGMCVAKLY